MDVLAKNTVLTSPARSQIGAASLPAAHQLHVTRVSQLPSFFFFFFFASTWFEEASDGKRVIMEKKNNTVVRS